MTVYDIPNIEHCTVTQVRKMFKLKTNDGWYIHLNNDIEDTVNIWKTAVILPVTYDFGVVEIRTAADLTEGAEIC